jgi:hypothetical protein
VPRFSATSADKQAIRAYALTQWRVSSRVSGDAK